MPTFWPKPLEAFTAGHEIVGADNADGAGIDRGGVAGACGGQNAGDVEALDADVSAVDRGRVARTRRCLDAGGAEGYGEVGLAERRGGNEAVPSTLTVPELVVVALPVSVLVRIPITLPLEFTVPEFVVVALPVFAGASIPSMPVVVIVPVLTQVRFPVRVGKGRASGAGRQGDGGRRRKRQQHDRPQGCTKKGCTQGALSSSWMKNRTGARAAHMKQEKT